MVQKSSFDLIYSSPPLEYLHNNIVSAHILNRLSLVSMQSLGSERTLTILSIAIYH